MLFSSMIFLWMFLPIMVIGCNLMEKKYKNIFLLIGSLIFYAWGEPKYILLMILCIIINYVFGLFIGSERKLSNRKILLALSVVSNLGILTYFKYFNFIASNLNMLFGKNTVGLREIALPVGISFYTFQALSYVIDVYRSKNNFGEVKSQKNIFDLALYVSFFPQLIAGPIVKYHDVNKQIEDRSADTVRIAYGIKRLILGLSKKILISNVMAGVADEVFMLSIHDMTTPVAWLGIICYSLQIYFDFSGYSDMAIGLGEMFGFTFMENFNYPYIAKSIQEFWKKWHISLSTWFKEYLYIPLGGNRQGELRTYVNLVIVFFVTGLWHGASWNFIIWGLFHGLLLVIEKKFLGEILRKNKFKIINHIYTIMGIMIGWVFFRTEDIRYALEYISKMFVASNLKSIYTVELFVNMEIMITLIAGILLCGTVQTIFPKVKNMLYERNKVNKGEVIILVILLVYSIISVASGTYNPFIYFRF